MFLNDESYWRKLKFALLQLSLLEYDEDDTLDQTSIIPMVDGGTEGKTLLQVEDLFVFFSFAQCSFPIFHESVKTITPR